MIKTLSNIFKQDKEKICNSKKCTAGNSHRDYLVRRDF